MLKLKTRKAIDAEIMSYKEYRFKMYGEVIQEDIVDLEGVCLLFRKEDGSIGFTEWLPKKTCEEFFVDDYTKEECDE